MEQLINLFVFGHQSSPVISWSCWNKLNSNKIENLKTKNTLTFNYSDFNKDSESLFSYNNEDEINFNNTANQENFELFQNIRDQDMKNYLVKNNIDFNGMQDY